MYFAPFIFIFIIGWVYNATSQLPGQIQASTLLILGMVCTLTSW